MIPAVFLATNNQGKIERFIKLLKDAAPEVKVSIAADLGIKPFEVAETGSSLAANALLKARAYLGKVNLPILANDTGFYVEGQGLVEAPKRAALAGANEAELTEAQLAQKILDFWKNIAQKHGGRVDAAWVEAFVLVMPDGAVREASSRREVILTDQEFGTPHIQFPMRALYISKATNQPAVTHAPAEETLEMAPVIKALKEVLI